MGMELDVVGGRIWTTKSETDTPDCHTQAESRNGCRGARRRKGAVDRRTKKYRTNASGVSLEQLMITSIQ